MSDEPTLGIAKFQFTQDEDTCGRPGHEYQEIEIEVQSGGGGKYLTISTERWSIDSPAELMRLLQKVQVATKDMKTVFGD